MKRLLDNIYRYCGIIYLERCFKRVMNYFHADEVFEISKEKEEQIFDIFKKQNALM